MIPSGKWIGLSLLLIAGGFAAWLLNQPAGDGKTAPGPEVSSHSRAPRVANATAPDPAETPSRDRIGNDWDSLIDWLNSSPAPSEEEIRARLLALRKAWAEMDPQDRAKAIDALLLSGKDAETGMKFQVGVHGMLAGWPTLRVFLLDILATADPEMAAAIARRLLDETSSAAEFATAMRSLTRQGPARAGNEELLHRFEKMLSRPDWQSSPAFAEAMDLARSVGTTGSAAALVQWNGPATLKSSALHEFAADHPGEMLQALASDSELPPVTRANLMARANPAAPEQLSEIDTYVRTADRPAEEVDAFLKSFPLRSATTGHRLYGRTPAPYTFEQVKAGDLAAHAQVERWLQDPLMQKYEPALQALKQRLETWISQAAKAEDAE